MKKAMCALIVPIEDCPGEYTWKEPRDIFVNAKTRKPFDWRKIVEKVFIKEGKGLWNWTRSRIDTILELADFLCGEVWLLSENGSMPESFNIKPFFCNGYCDIEPEIMIGKILVILENFYAVRNMPAGSVVLGAIDGRLPPPLGGDDDKIPLFLIWEEETV